jgi:hypothetical protein
MVHRKILLDEKRKTPRKHWWFLVLFSSILFSISNAQDHPQLSTIDQIRRYYESLSALSTNTADAENITNGKCGLGINAAVHTLWSQLDPQLQAKIRISKTAAPQTSRTIGRFQFFYDTTGGNEPALLDTVMQRVPHTAEAYVDSLGRIFNEVYQKEILELGYEAPPYEQGFTAYRILISNMSSYATGTYGSTNWEDNIPPLNPGDPAPRYATFIEIHNDFRTFNTKGMDAVRVTAAHEFHHMVQIGSYGYWSNDIYAYELTSTWMEDVIYTAVNDYYNYLSDYFVGFRTGLAFNSSSFAGYERCVWGHYLAKRFGVDCMKHVWTNMKQKPFLESTNDALLVQNSSMKSAFAEFAIWNYYTADRANPEKYYPEGAFYPRYQPIKRTTIFGGSATASADVQPLSSSIFEITMNPDTLSAIVANIEYETARQHITTSKTVTMTIAFDNISGSYDELTNGAKVQISFADPSLWRWSYAQRGLFSLDIKRSGAGPNPLILSQAERLVLPVSGDWAQASNVFFYNAAFDLIYAGIWNIVFEYGTHIVSIPSADLRSHLSSGTYFVLAKTETKDYQWKIVVIR